MGSSLVRETRRFGTGETVWVSPSVSGEWLCEDEAMVMEDLGMGYLVLQTNERVDSHGYGHFVCDLELERLFEPVYIKVPPMVQRDRRLLDFNTRALGILGRARCDRGGIRRRVPAHA